MSRYFVEASFTDAGNAAFQRLFRCISGNSVTQHRIAMTAPFTNLQNWIYWSGTKREFFPVAAWYFAPTTGFEYLDFKLHGFHA